MRHKRLKLSAILLLGITLTSLQAQESVNATGSSASGSGGSVSYSVGQVIYTTNTGTNGSVAQGVQQPCEIFTVTGIENTAISLVQIAAYPNPVTNYLELSVEMENTKDLSFQLFDIHGRLLQTQKLTSSNTQIDMTDYIPSTYFIKVISGNQSLKEFKIIKN